MKFTGSAGGITLDAERDLAGDPVQCGVLGIVHHPRLAGRHLPTLGASIIQKAHLPPESDEAVAHWMRSHGWDVSPAGWEQDPEAGFHVWQDEPTSGRSHALWIAESMVGHLSPEELVDVLNREGVAEEIRINFRIRIEERGEEYRVSPVPRRSGESRRQE